MREKKSKKNGSSMVRRLPRQRKSKYRAWADLNPDVLGNILKNLHLQELLQDVPLVCKSWRNVVDGPYCWQSIDERKWRFRYNLSPARLNKIHRMLILRSSESLQEINLSYVDNSQMLLIAAVGKSLKTLELKNSTVTDSTLTKVAKKLPLLTTLGIVSCDSITSEGLESIGRSCQMLVSLRWIQKIRGAWSQIGKLSLQKDAQAVARTMPKLKRLIIVSDCYINNSIALDILKGCPQLEILDVRGCWGFDLDIAVLEHKYPRVKIYGRCII